MTGGTLQAKFQGAVRAGLLAGRTMGGYRLYREIASGGMGSIYLGHKPGPGGFGQVAALKVVHPHLVVHREFVHMFLDEARIAARIQHPNVCRIFDFGYADDTYYMVMEYLMGETLTRVLAGLEGSGQEGATPATAALLARVMSQVCEGLHAAHEVDDALGQPLNVVHRDVSPQNIFVTDDGGVRVLDFGIATAAERLQTTNHGSVKGRFAYMSPEHMSGEPVDRRSDVWSVGVVLWEALAGRRLFRRGTDSETIMAVTSGALPPLPGDRPHVSQALWGVALKALQRDRARRYQTAREMGAELAALGAGAGPLPAAEIARTMAHLFGHSAVERQALRRRVENYGRDPSGAVPVSGSWAASSASLSGLPDLSWDASPPAPSSLTPSGVTTIAATEPAATAVRGRGARLASAILLAGVLLMATGWFVRGRMHAASPRSLPGFVLRAPASAVPPLGASTGAPQLFPLVSAEPASLPVEPVSAGPALEPMGGDGRAVPAPWAPRRAQGAARSPLNDKAKRQPVLVAGREGTLNVTTPGCWADLYEGTRKLGSTPGSFPLTAGVHDLRVDILGRGSASHERVRVKPGAITRLKLPCP